MAPRLTPKRDHAIDPLWITRQSLDREAMAHMPGCGWLPPAWLPDASLRRALRTASRAATQTLTNYDSTLGPKPLRDILAARLAERGLNVREDGLLLTDSATQAVDLLCRLLLEPGECVILDDPCYFNFHALLGAFRVKIVTVPYTAAGPDLEAFEQILQRHRPRLYITNSALQNPTGWSLSAFVAHRLLKLAERENLFIIEDDVFGDFEWEPKPRLAALDGLQRVAQVGGFAKTLSASARCGYIAAKPEWIDSLVDLKIATSLSSSRLSAEIVYAALKDGRYRKHMAALREQLAQAAARVARQLDAIGVTASENNREMAQGGIFLWRALPNNLDAAAVTRRAFKKNIILAPGAAFSLTDHCKGFMRFNVAQMADPEIFATLERLMKDSAKAGETLS